jgi:hemoglobin
MKTHLLQTLAKVRRNPDDCVMTPNIERILCTPALLGAVMLAGCGLSIGSSAPVAGVPAPAESPAPNAGRDGRLAASLYSRLGGEAGIAAFTDDFLIRTMTDPALMPFFKGLTDDDDKRIHQHLRELLCAVTGGGCTYTGKDMKTAHAQMEISNDVWNQFTGHFNETVARFHIADRERNELVNIVASVKKDIVNK